MSIALRVLLIVVSFLTLVLIIAKVRKSRIRIEDSVSWICIASLLLVISIFPQIVYFFTDILGIVSPVNLVFLVMIFALFVQCTNLSIRLSQTVTKTKELTQQLAIEQFERQRTDEKLIK